MTFAYTARDTLGNVHEGRLEAVGEEEARQKLRRDGFTVVSLDDGDDSAGLFPRRISKIEIVYLTSQLAIMTDTGITLSVAIEGIAEQAENPSLRTVLLDIKGAVESGEDFSAALAKHPKHFDQTYISLIRASEQTGALAEMLDRIATYLRKETEMRSKVRAAMAYPTVMLVLATGVTIFLLTYVLPKFTPIFERKGITLPTPTVIIIGVSHLILDYWAAWLALVVTISATYLLGRRTATGRKTLDWCKLNMPLVGTLFRKIAISRSIRTLGAMVASGVSMLDSIQLSADVAGNIYYQESWLRVLDAVTRGERIATSLLDDPLFPRTLVQMISAGEETGQLDKVLYKVSNYYDSEVETSLKTATSLIEPLMITAMGVIVGGIGLGLMLPIFSLSRGMG